MMPNFTHALRILRKDPVFTGVAICSLAIGIGATASMFSFGDAMLLRPLPVADPSSVVAVNTSHAATFGINPPISYPDYTDLRDRNRTFSGLVAASYATFGFGTNPQSSPRMKFGLYVSGNFFRVLGVEPALGRGFRPDDEDQAEGRDAVVILGYDFWAGQFAHSPSVLGSRIRLNGVDFTIIGVAPQHFTGIDTVFRPQIFVPIAMAPRLSHQKYLHDRDAGWLMLKGRLKPGVTLEQAQADIAALSPDLQKLHAADTRDRRYLVETELQYRIAQGPEVVTMEIMLAVLALCVLLVACANVAGLLLSRARARSREIAVRLAIGAGRGVLMRQLLFENLLVAIAGGFGSLLVCDFFADLCRRVPVPSDLPIVFDATVNNRVLLCTLLVSVLSTLLFGLAPALRATRPDLVPALKSLDADSAGHKRLWGRHAIVAGQVAVSLVLLAISAALVQSFSQQLLQGPGFRIDRLLVASFNTQMARYSDDQTRRFWKDLLDRTRTTPGVRSVALSSQIPMQSAAASLPLIPDGWQLPRGETSITTFGAYVSDGFFSTLQIPILQGRDFRESDNQNSPLVAVVNSQMAAHFWKGDALGKRFQLGTGGPMVQIVGIVKTCKYIWIAEAPVDFAYMPYRQHLESTMSLAVQSAAQDANAIAPALRAVVRSLDPDVPIYDVRTMRDVFTQIAVKHSQFLMEVVAGMGVLALILAVIGLYGLVAYSVSRRTREIGIRMALGADRHAVIWMVLRQGLLLSAAGVAIGLIAAFFLCPAITSGVAITAARRVNPYVFIALPLLLIAITALAAWAPARRASMVDPLVTLRDE